MSKNFRYTSIHFLKNLDHKSYKKGKKHPGQVTSLSIPLYQTLQFFFALFIPFLNESFFFLKHSNALSVEIQAKSLLSCVSAMKY